MCKFFLFFNFEEKAACKKGRKFAVFVLTQPMTDKIPTMPSPQTLLLIPIFLILGQSVPFYKCSQIWIQPRPQREHLIGIGWASQILPTSDQMKMWNRDENWLWSSVRLLTDKGRHGRSSKSPLQCSSSSAPPLLLLCCIKISFTPGSKQMAPHPPKCDPAVLVARPIFALGNNIWSIILTSDR